MRFYAERPVRAACQLLADVLVVVWVYLTVVVALRARDLLDQLQAPGRALVGAGDGIRDAFNTAAGAVGGVPFVGDELSGALRGAAGAGVSLSDAGRGQVESVATFSVGTAVMIVAVFAVPVVLVWLTLRLRYARLAGAAVAVRAIDTDLLALRALSRVDVHTLLAVSPDPAAAWRRDDRAVVHRLAALELRSLGLRAPAPPD
jgi:hypothetical protein